MPSTEIVAAAPRSHQTSTLPDDSTSADSAGRSIIPPRLRPFAEPTLLPGENRHDYEVIRQLLIDDILPRTNLDWLLTFDLVELSWEILRYRRLKHRVLESHRERAIANVPSPPSCNILMAPACPTTPPPRSISTAGALPRNGATIPPPLPISSIACSPPAVMLQPSIPKPSCRPARPSPPSISCCNPPSTAASSCSANSIHDGNSTPAHNHTRPWSMP